MFLTERSSRIRVIVALALTVLTFAVFWPALTAEFVRYDDDWHVTGNPNVANGFSREGIRWAFSSGLFSHSPRAPHWQPLTFLSHMLDVEFYGLNPAGHHLTNLLLHVVNALLLFWIVERLTGALWRSAFVAALFALHPLHVESVAWVSERKDVLSGLWFLLALGAYGFYAKRPRWGRYLGAVLFFILGLMTKPMLVTFPLVLFLLDFWPLGRFKTVPKQRLFLEKIPLVVLSGASSWLTMAAQSKIEAVTSLEQLPFAIRAAHACQAYLRYIGKMLWPVDLAVFYPYPDAAPAAWKTVLALVALAAATVYALRLRDRYPYLLTGWFWYGLTLLPVIGLVQAGFQSMADRYTYLPLIGLFVVAAWGAGDFFLRLKHRKVFAGVLAGILLSVLGAGTWAQAGYWKDSVRLFQHALDVTPGNYMAHSQLCILWTEKGALDKAADHCFEAARLRPNWADAQNGLGAFFERQAKLDEAIDRYRQALRLRPHHVLALNNLGYALIQKGALEEAVAPLSQALGLDPDFPEAHNNLGLALILQGKNKEAEFHYRRAIGLRADYAEAYNNLGVGLARQDRFEEAKDAFSKALALKPSDGDTIRNLEWVKKTLSERKTEKESSRVS